MQFKHPELLYALCLLLIPIIVHLFQLRRFQKVNFTNVAFLKEVTQQTRKSSQLKKWLTLLTRLALLACIIIAFAQPFTANTNTFNKPQETVIYLDNSFSMQAQGEQGELLKRAVQDIIDNVDAEQNISVLTNTESFKNTTIKSITNELLQLQYNANQLPYDIALLKAKQLFSKQPNSVKHVIYVSDFQQQKQGFNTISDSTTQVHYVQLEPENISNVAIDTAYISATTPSQLELTVGLSNHGSPIENVPVSLFNKDNLIAKTAVSITDEATTTFTLPRHQNIQGKLSIDDTNLQFDNSLFFNINTPKNINVLAVNETDDAFLKKLYNPNEFNYTSTALSALNYNVIASQHLIILNELPTIPEALSNTLKTFMSNGGYVVVIPAKNSNLNSYNHFVNTFKAATDTEKRITTINFDHPLYANKVFEKRVDNFQYPKVNYGYTLGNTSSANILSFADNSPFLSQQGNAFIFASPLHTKATNFKQSPLIVPTFYNMAKQGLQLPNLYYTVGKSNTYDVAVNLQQDGVLALENKVENIIPQQHYFNNKVAITTDELPEQAGIFNVKNKTETLQQVSYNFNRDESVLRYLDLEALNSDSASNTIAKVFTTLKSETNINALWKWFVIFALVFLIIEMLILKYFK